MPESTWELMLPFQVFHPMLGDGQMSNSTTFQATKLKGNESYQEKMGMFLCMGFTKTSLKDL